MALEGDYHRTWQRASIKGLENKKKWPQNTFFRLNLELAALALCAGRTPTYFQTPYKSFKTKHQKNGPTCRPATHCKDVSSLGFSIAFAHPRGEKVLVPIWTSLDLGTALIGGKPVKLVQKISYGNFSHPKWSKHLGLIPWAVSRASVISQPSHAFPPTVVQMRPTPSGGCTKKTWWVRWQTFHRFLMGSSSSKSWHLWLCRTYCGLPFYLPENREKEKRNHRTSKQKMSIKSSYRHIKKTILARKSGHNPYITNWTESIFWRWLIFARNQLVERLEPLGLLLPEASSKYWEKRCW